MRTNSDDLRLAARLSLPARDAQPRHWRTPCIAFAVAALLHAILWLALGHAAPSVLAAANTDALEVHTGVLLSRPVEAVGTWTISETHEGITQSVSFTVTAETEVAPGINTGDCVEVKAAANTTAIAHKIVLRSAGDCADDPGGGHDDGPEGSFVESKGVVNSRPAGKVGTWVISDTTYSANELTLVEDTGGIFVGECVLIKVNDRAPAVAIKIIEKRAHECNADDGGPGGGDGNEGDNEEFRREWEGTIVEFPPELIGEWVIAVGASKRITFTSDLRTRLTPDLPTAYDVGRWVEVRMRRQSGGALVADRVRVDEYELGEIVVRLSSADISGTIASKYHLVLTSTLLRQANIYLFTTTSDNERGLAQQIAKEQGVIWAEVNYVNGVPEEDGYKTWGWGGKSEPDEYANQSAYSQIRMGQTTKVYQGDDVVVAVLDTGVYTPHEQFAGRLQLPSLDVIDDDSDPSDEGPGLAWGHGTHVAGVIAAMAPHAMILPVRVLDENGRGNTFLLAYAIEWVAQQPGVKVINLSLGTEFDSKILRDVIQKATERGIIVVAAAGNSGTSQMQYPAGYQNVVAVTALDENSVKADFANYGSKWVDVAAPGVGIMSTMISEDGPGYATWSGTSMATAFVSGAAALVAQKWSVAATTYSGLLAQLVDTGLLVDALNPSFVGQIGRQLDVSAALDVDPQLLFMPASAK